MAFDKFHDECGVFGILHHRDAANLVYLGLYALQHRGQESAGIASISTFPDADTEPQGDALVPDIYIEKEMGQVAEIFTEERLTRLPGDTAIGHVRYSTAGGSYLRNAQPLVASTSKGPFAIAHNGNLVNGKNLRQELEQEGAIFNTLSDTETVVHLLSRSAAPDVETAFLDALSQVRGAYSMVALAPGRILAARDPNGFRPLVIGRLEGRYCVASETCAFDLIGAEIVREVKAGEVVVLEVTADGSQRIRTLREGYGRREARCIFEHVYFARPDSQVFGLSVAATRKKFGAQVAIEHPVEADLVVPVPDSGVFAALGYAQESGIPFEYGLVRNHYVGRTFIEPKQTIRSFGVKVKLNPVRHLVEGKRLVLVDDSIVRGTTSKKIVRLLKQAGASEVHMRISSPPTTGPCHYGIDTPKRQELIAAKNTIAEICEYIGADSLGYLTPAGMLDAIRDGSENPAQLYCTACFTGEYPVPSTEDELALEAVAP